MESEQLNDRQSQRAVLRDRQYAATRVPGNAHHHNGYQPEPRKARRQLARALASKAWKTRSVQAAAQPI